MMRREALEVDGAFGTHLDPDSRTPNGEEEDRTTNSQEGNKALCAPTRASPLVQALKQAAKPPFARMHREHSVGAKGQRPKRASLTSTLPLLGDSA